MLKDLIKLANHLDQKGLRKEADDLDCIVKKAAWGDDPRATKDNKTMEDAARLYIGKFEIDAGDLRERRRLHAWIVNSFPITWGDAETLIRNITEPGRRGEQVDINVFEGKKKEDFDDGGAL